MAVYTAGSRSPTEQDDPANTTSSRSVPLGTGRRPNLDIQSYAEGRRRSISASISSFADRSGLAAVDRATVKAVTKNFAAGCSQRRCSFSTQASRRAKKTHPESLPGNVLVTAKERPRGPRRINDTRSVIDKATTP